jgi:radial spoke head protein 9
LLFWGRIDGAKQNYYICLGVTFTDKYEFPEKRFYWASSADFKFKNFPTLNDQHFEAFDSIQGLFSGDPNKIHINVVPEKPPGDDNDAAQDNVEPPKEKDPLASTEEEDPNASFVPRNFTELDRLQITVYAIENDCHIMPKGAVKLTD